MLERHRLAGWIGLLALLAAGGLARAQTAACDALQGEQKALADKLLASQYPYDCCDQPIAVCLKQEPVCPLARRLAENICRRVAAGQDEARITRSLSRRARSMMALGKPTEIDLAGVPMAGDPQAPVVLVEYACARCPFCSRLTPAIHQAVTAGPLRGKVRLYFKTFPIRDHPHSKEAGLAFVAAARLGRFWDFALYAYAHFDQFCVDKQQAWAEAVGLDGPAFARLLADPTVRQQLVASKKEGLRNKVAATPTFFIDGRRWVGDLEIPELVDALEEEAERLTSGR